MPRRKKRSKKKHKSPLKQVFTRYMLIVAVFIFWIAAIGVRLVHLQVNQHEWLRAQALEQRQYEHKTKMLRGTIFDRSERALAMSVKVKSLYADPTKFEDIEETVDRIAKLVKVNKNKLVQDLTVGKSKNRKFVWIKRKLNEEEFERVNENLVDEGVKKASLPKAEGFYWREEQKRSYPYKNLAAHVIGFTNSEHKGRAGIEMSQERALKGDVISTVRERDRLGRVYEETVGEQNEPKDVVLTISNSIQYKTEEALAKGARRTNSRAGKAIVLDPKTGEILAMANYPTFDPNKNRKLKPNMWKNRAIQDNYSPGSIFKVVTYASALEENLIENDKEIDCGNGTITVAGHTFNDSHAVGTVSYQEAFAHSSNVGAIKTAMQVGRENFYRYAKRFGFGEETQISLPAETRGVLHSPNKWNGDSLASMSIGYEIDVTALQSAVAFATIANNGVKVQPHIVKEVRHSDGKIYSSTVPKHERVVSVETARSMRKMMRQVVMDGTAKQAQLKGYTSAGKTGTAWKYDAKNGGFNKNKYVSSFIGFAPANDPRVVIAVIMDEPKGAFRNGGQVAAPIFADIAEQVLPELNVTPDGTLPDESFEDESDEFDENIEPEEPLKNEKELNTTVAKKAVKPKKKNKEKKKKSDNKDNKRKKEKSAVADRKNLRARKTGVVKNKET